MLSRSGVHSRACFVSEQVPYDRSLVILSDSPGMEYFGAHKDRVTWSLMITILRNPKQDGHSRKSRHTVKKFRVPEYVTELLEGMTFVTGFGIRGDVHSIEDTLGGLEDLQFR